MCQKVTNNNVELGISFKKKIVVDDRDYKSDEFIVHLGCSKQQSIFYNSISEEIPVILCDLCHLMELHRFR